LATSSLEEQPTDLLLVVRQSILCGKKATICKLKLKRLQMIEIRWGKAEFTSSAASNCVTFHHW
jgi:hypothetical protein